VNRRAEFRTRLQYAAARARDDELLKWLECGYRTRASFTVTTLISYEALRELLHARISSPDSQFLRRVDELPVDQ